MNVKHLCNDKCQGKAKAFEKKKRTGLPTSLCSPEISHGPSWYATLVSSLMARPVTGPTCYPMRTGGTFPAIKRLEREADKSPPFSAEIKNSRTYKGVSKSFRTEPIMK
jgi:hypothetical protein